MSTTATYTMGALACTGLATVGSLQCNGDATTTGNLTVGSTLNSDALVWATGKIGSTGAPLTTGQGGSNWQATRSSTGIYRITFSTAHPAGANYTVQVTAHGMLSYVRYSTNPPTSTYFEVVSYSTSFVLTDAPWSFIVMNW